MPCANEDGTRQRADRAAGGRPDGQLRATGRQTMALVHHHQRHLADGFRRAAQPHAYPTLPVHHAISTRARCDFEVQCAEADDGLRGGGGDRPPRTRGRSKPPLLEVRQGRAEQTIKLDSRRACGTRTLRNLYHVVLRLRRGGRTAGHGAHLFRHAQNRFRAGQGIRRAGRACGSTASPAICAERFTSPIIPTASTPPRRSKR